MKRSKRLVLTSLMAGGGLSMNACGGDAPAPTQWGDPPAAAASAVPEDGAAFASVEECKAAGEFAPAECDAAYATAQADAPKFNDRQTCEERYGVDQCVPRNSGGGSFFTPLLTGFIIGQALNNFGGGRGYGGFYGRDRDRYFGGGYGGYGGGYRPGGYVTGRDTRYRPPTTQAPTRAQSRSAVVSRGGFGGGGGRSRGG